MGTENWIPIHTWENVDEILSQVDSNFKIVGLENDENAESIFTFKWPHHGLLILGNEETGIHPDLIKKCDVLVKIPLFGRKESLNVANAFSICAYELRKNFYGD